MGSPLLPLILHPLSSASVQLPVNSHEGRPLPRSDRSLCAWSPRRQLEQHRSYNHHPRRVPGRLLSLHHYSSPNRIVNIYQTQSTISNHSITSITFNNYYNYYYNYYNYYNN